MAVTKEPTHQRLVIRSEKDLEDYFIANPSLLGEDLMIIGRQVRARAGLIDLLAIDSTGALTMVELKLEKADKGVIAQVSAYRFMIKRLNREAIIRIAATHGLGLDLARDYERRFARPLPIVINQSQHTIIVAASVHTTAAWATLGLLEDGHAISTFRYVVGTDAVSLVPCCRSDRDVREGTHFATKLSAKPKHATVLPTRKAKRTVDKTVRRFWATHAQNFAPFATFRFIFERYELWTEAQGIPTHHIGHFAGQLRATTAETDEWTRVYISRHRDMAPYNTIKAPSDTQPKFGGDYTRVAYKRNPI